MKAKQVVMTLVVLTVALLGAGFIEGFMVSVGLINPVVGGLTLPVFSAVAVFISLWLLKKYGKAEATL